MKKLHEALHTGMVTRVASRHTARQAAPPPARLTVRPCSAKHRPRGRYIAPSVQFLARSSPALPSPPRVRSAAPHPVGRAGDV